MLVAFFSVLVPVVKFLKVSLRKIKSSTDFVCIKSKANVVMAAEEVNDFEIIITHCRYFSDRMNTNFASRPRHKAFIRNLRYRREQGLVPGSYLYHPSREPVCS